MATEQPQYLRNPVYVNGPGDQLSAIWCSTDRTSDHPDRERGTRCEGGPGPGVQPPLSGAVAQTEREELAAGGLKACRSKPPTPHFTRGGSALLPALGALA